MHVTRALHYVYGEMHFVYAMHLILIALLKCNAPEPAESAGCFARCIALASRLMKNTHIESYGE